MPLKQPLRSIPVISPTWLWHLIHSPFPLWRTHITWAGDLKHITHPIEYYWKTYWGVDIYPTHQKTSVQSNVFQYVSLSRYSILNPSNAEAISLSKALGCKDLWKPFKPCHVGIHWIALAEYFQMSTHMSGFQYFLGCFHHFVVAKLATRVKHLTICNNTLEWMGWICPLSY